MHHAFPPRVARGDLGSPELHERDYSGEPVPLAGTLCGLYNKDTHTIVFASAADELGHRTHVKLFRLASKLQSRYSPAVRSFTRVAARTSRHGSPIPATACTTKTPRIDPITAMLDDVKARER